MPSDIVRLPSGKMMTRTRALALGLLDENGAVRADVPADSQAEGVLRRDARQAQFAASQAITPTEKEALTRGQKAAATRAANKAAAKAGGEPEVTTDGLPKGRKAKIEPLRPQNVDHDGQPVTDEATLAAIAAAAEALAAAGAEFDGSTSNGSADPEDSIATGGDEEVTGDEPAEPVDASE